MHEPVLLKEVFEVLEPKSGDFFVDATLGMAGHAKKAVKKISPGGFFVGIDRDPDSFKKGKQKLAEYVKEENLEVDLSFFQTNFTDLPQVIKELERKPDCILFDLGFSTFQVFSGKGFSYDQDEPLIMRYDGDVSKLTAARVLNEYDKKKLAQILKQYGEERFAERIADGITKQRREESLRTTKDLVKAVRGSLPPNYPSKKRPEARVFLALRNFINHEPEDLKEMVEFLPDVLSKTGKAVIITFNSLEDRIVKKSFKSLSEKGRVELLTKKPIKPSKKEIEKNNYARSAKIRAIKNK
jgi:16S rRNA (cytosine1402-N4)-methyltransferase